MFFSTGEFEERRDRVRGLMSREGIDALLISTPENVYYLCGFDHLGYFAFQALILPADGTPILVTRAMERVTVADMVPELQHYGYADGSTPLPSAPHDEESTDLLGVGGSVFVEPRLVQGSHRRGGVAPVEETCRALAEAGLGRAHLAIEEGGSFLTPRIAAGIKSGMSGARWTDGTGLVDRVRSVQSPAEVACTRQAAVISDGMLQAGVASAGVGVAKGEVMAAIYDAMFRRGGTYPGFVPLVRSSSSLTHEHGTWDDAQLGVEDILFVELSGCVRRYHAPMGRLAFIDRAPANAEEAHEVCEEALLAAADAIRPEASAGDVYEAWQSVLDRRGLSAYTRHHCGYSVGIGYPPSWSGGGVPLGLRAGSDMKLQSGMVFHLMSWLLRSDLGDSFVSDTVLVGDKGCEFLTRTPRQVFVRY